MVIRTLREHLMLSFCRRYGNVTYERSETSTLADERPTKSLSKEINDIQSFCANSFENITKDRITLNKPAVDQVKFESPARCRCSHHSAP